VSFRSAVLSRAKCEVLYYVDKERLSGLRPPRMPQALFLVRKRCQKELGDGWASQKRGLASPLF
jgi:hypothetical protein